jgi:hypothetical protein
MYREGLVTLTGANMTHVSPPRRLGSNECFCTACGRIFNGERNFDLHRTGPFQPQGRRCLSDVELQKAGMVYDAQRNRWGRSLPQGRFPLQRSPKQAVYALSTWMDPRSLLAELVGFSRPIFLSMWQPALAQQDGDRDRRHGAAAGKTVRYILHGGPTAC